MTEREAWLETAGGHIEEIGWEIARIKAELRNKSRLHALLVRVVDRVARWRIWC